jgi:hypothetical protein
VPTIYSANGTGNDACPNSNRSKTTAMLPTVGGSLSEILTTPFCGKQMFFSVVVSERF